MPPRSSSSNRAGYAPLMSSSSTALLPALDDDSTPSPLLGLLDASQYYPTFEIITKHLNFQDIIRLSSTCRRLRSLQKQVINLELNIDRYLAAWFKDPVALRTVMAQQNVIIGSHYATAFFSREFPATSIRFYVNQGPQAQALEAFLTEEGYEESARQEREGAANAESRRRKFIRPPPSPTSTVPACIAEIRLCSTSPVGAFLAAVNSTHLLNLITSHRAYALFPISSHISKMSFITRDLNTDSVQHTLARYSQFNYTFQPIIWNSSRLPYTMEVTSPRRFGDKYTWIIEFDNSKIPPPTVPQSVVESTCFRLSITPDPILYAGRQQNLATARYRLSCSGFKSSVLKYTYTFGCSAWRAYVGARVDALNRIELFKLSAKDRQGINMGAKRDYYQFEGMFQKPASWRYFDKEVLVWWEEWCRENPVGGNGNSTAATGTGGTGPGGAVPGRH